MMRLTGITARTTLLAWTVTLVTLGTFVVIIIPEQEHDLQKGLESKAQGVAAALQGEVAGAAISEDYSSVVDHAMQVLNGDKALDFLVITKNDGYALIVERDAWRVVPKVDEYWRPQQRVAAGSIEKVPEFNTRVFHYAVPFDYSGLQWGWINVGLSLKTYDASVRMVFLRTGILAVVCIFISFIASLLYARRFVEPVLRLRSVVERVAGGDYSARASIRSNDEIEQLAGAFNNMADAVLQRNRIVESVRFAAQSLQDAGDWQSVIDQVLGKIGQATNASRVMIWVQDEGGHDLPAAPENTSATVQFDWTAEGIESWRGQRSKKTLSAQGLGRLTRQGHEGEVLIARSKQPKVMAVAGPGAEALSEILLPILAGGNLWGALAVQDCLHDREWREVESDSLRAVAEMLGASIARQNAQLALIEVKSQLEIRVAARTQELRSQIAAKDRAHAELEEAQRRLIELSRLSGMAEVATAVLHNVGNVLNSINVSSTLIGDRLRGSRIRQLGDLSRILMEHQEDIGSYLHNDPGGRRVIPYLDKLSDHLVKERDELCSEAEGLVHHVAHVKDIVAMQQTYARTSGVLEKVAFHTLIEDALRITRDEMDRHSIHLWTDIDETPVMTMDRNKVLQILLNLLRNAKDAVNANPSSTRDIAVRLRAVGEDRVRLEVIDSGVGIPPENLTRVFSHGFTTKRDGHGFGLHFGALTARQLGGSLSTHSEGLGLGATFTLELPIDGKNANDERSNQ